MKHYISLLLILLSSWPIMAQGDFNPNNPDEPGPQYFLTVNISPAEAGSISPSGKNLYTFGQKVYLYTYGNSNYRFKGWMQGNLLINESTSFDYTISTYNAVITAVYEYEPTSPTEPDPLPIRRKLTLASTPQEGGYFNLSNETIFKEGETVTVQAYPNTGYVFERWESDGKIISTNSSYPVTLGKTNVSLTGVFRFDPVSPPSPNVNSWNATTGELIIDDFTPGYLSSAIDSKIGGSGNRNKVLKITVAGNMTSGDFGILNGLSSCVELDLSRVTGITSILSYAFYYGSFSKIILPLVIENIGAYAFYACSNLVEIISYTIDPPVLGTNVFGNINANAILYVLQAAIPEYSNAEQWKEFLIMPLSDEVGALTVSLPASANDGMYKNMFLELVHTGTAQKQKFVTTEKLSYTFRGLLTGSKYNVYLKDKNDVLLGEINNVEITGNDTRAAFSSLLKLYTVQINVRDKANADVTSQTAIRWYNADNKFVAQGNSIEGLTVNTELKYSVELNSVLGSQYVQPAQKNHTVSASGNTLSCPLQLIDTVKIQGVVTDENKSPVSDAIVSVSQMLNGKFTKALTAKTDRQGRYTATVYNDISTITVSAPEYISKSISLANFNAGLVMDTVKLAVIKGTVITTEFTYTSSVVEGETVLKTNGYANYQNVAYTLYNVTKGTAISNYSVQYPSIVLLEPVDVGDQLRITASSKVGEFEPVTCVVTVGAENKATALINIVELGTVKATYIQSANVSNVAILYNSSGQFVKRSDYSNRSVTFKGLPDGAYTLVSMANNRLYNSILNLPELTASGLAENADFVKATINARSGVIKELSVPLIPTLDEQKLYYTGDNTSFTAGKSSIVAGNYMTLSGRISFKEAYRSKVSNVKMIVDLPESCSFVDNSIMEGSKVTGSYIIDGNRLTIPLTGYAELVRFCIIPTQGGSLIPNAFVEFDLNGELIKQPIGAANFTVENLSIVVPSLTARKTITVSGAATPKSGIKVYDSDVFVGETTALANGSWSMSCELYKPYALSYHNIHAKIVTPQGLAIQTETKQVTHNETAIEVSKVTMYYSNPEISKNYEFVFDFLNPSTQSQNYVYYIYNKSFTFTIDFTNNSPAAVSDVILYVHTDHGNKVPLIATYDEKKDIWVANGNFGDMYTGELPVNVSVDYVAQIEINIDTFMDEILNPTDRLIINEIVTLIDDESHSQYFVDIDGETFYIDYCKFTLQNMNNLIAQIQDFGFTKNFLEGFYTVFTMNNSLILFNIDNLSISSFISSSEADILDIISSRNYKEKQKSSRNIFHSQEAKAAQASKKDIQARRDAVFKKIAELVNCPTLDPYTKDVLATGQRSIRGRLLWLYSTVGVTEMANLLTFYPGGVNASTQLLGELIKDLPGNAGVIVQLENEVLNMDNPCDGTPKPPCPPLIVTIDPSGYVYETVPSNRLQGVTTTAYYKSWVENMYGDREEKVILWDASEYSQENPLLTDENGMYAWDVPAGLWQVKYEKDGYQTTYSEWLPVPPPQLDVNIAMVQVSQPYVQAVHGYESGIEIEFNKFMLPATLTDAHIIVTRNGEVVSGTIQILNEEAAPDSADKFVSKVRFVPSQPFAVTDKVILSVNRKVESYAGISMESDFMQQISIEKEINAIKVVSSIDMEDNSTESIQISVEPKEAASGKKIIAHSASSSIVGVTNEVVLNAEGIAMLQIKSELPGTTQITVSVEGMNLKANVTVNVAMPKAAMQQLDKPTASVPSGSTVEKNSTVSLASNTEGAVIYYTLDDSSPYEAGRLEYTQAIVISKDITIQAIASKEGMLDSEIATFEYVVESSGINQVDKCEISAYTRNRILYIKGLKPKEQYTVYSVIGNKVVQGKAIDEFEQKIMLPNKGVFILSVEGINIKVLVE